MILPLGSRNFLHSSVSESPPTPCRKARRQTGLFSSSAESSQPASDVPEISNDSSHPADSMRLTFLESSEELAAEDFVHCAKRLINGRIGVSAGARIGIGDRDAPERLPALHPRFLSRLHSGKSSPNGVNAYPCAHRFTIMPSISRAGSNPAPPSIRPSCSRMLRSNVLYGVCRSSVRPARF